MAEKQGAYPGPSGPMPDAPPSYEASVGAGATQGQAGGFKVPPPVNAAYPQQQQQAAPPPQHAGAPQPSKYHINRKLLLIFSME